MQRTTFLLLLTFIFLTSCENQQQSKENAKEITYAVAYNVLVNSDSSNYDIFIVNTDGIGNKNITNHKDVAWTYYAFKDRLFFISDRDTCYRCFFLYEKDANGNNIRKISDLQLEDSWMSSRNNGEEMVVSGRIGKALRMQLFIVNTKTGSYQQVTNDTAAFYRDPVFSPDGKQIVCSYKANKRDRNQHEELYIMNADGTNLHQITHYPENDISLNENGYKAGAAHWHPTENFITYISMQSGKHSIYAVTPDGNKQWKLTENDFIEGWHDWSPDGKWLAFDSANEDESQYHIMLMNWQTKEMKQLTDSAYKYQQSPVFVDIVHP